MDRRYLYLIAALVAFARGPYVSAQNPEAPACDRTEKPADPDGLHQEDTRKKWRTLPPQQQEHFRKNLEIWKQMPPEKKEGLRRSAEWRRKTVRTDAEQLKSELQLQLSPEQEQQFLRRYVEERRKIEQSLREEMEAKRKPLLKELGSRLQQEFSSPQPNPTSSPVPSTTPK